MNQVGVLLIFMVAAIVLAKKKAPVAWGLYALGTGLTFLSLLGQQRQANFFGMGGKMTQAWVISAVIAILGAVIIWMRSDS